MTLNIKDPNNCKQKKKKNKKKNVCQEKKVKNSSQIIEHNDGKIRNKENGSDCKNTISKITEDSTISYVPKLKKKVKKTSNKDIDENKNICRSKHQRKMAKLNRQIVKGNNKNDCRNISKESKTSLKNSSMPKKIKKIKKSFNSDINSRRKKETENNLFRGNNQKKKVKINKLIIENVDEKIMNDNKLDSKKMKENKKNSLESKMRKKSRISKNKNKKNENNNLVRNYNHEQKFKIAKQIKDTKDNRSECKNKQISSISKHKKKSFNNDNDLNKKKNIMDIKKDKKKIVTKNKQVIEDIDENIVNKENRPNYKKNCSEKIIKNKQILTLPKLKKKIKNRNNNDNDPSNNNNNSHISDNSYNNNFSDNSNCHSSDDSNGYLSDDSDSQVESIHAYFDNEAEEVSDIDSEEEQENEEDIAFMGGSSNLSIKDCKKSIIANRDPSLFDLYATDSSEDQTDSDMHEFIVSDSDSGVYSNKYELDSELDNDKDETDHEFYCDKDETDCNKFKIIYRPKRKRIIYRSSSSEEEVSSNASRYLSNFCQLYNSTDLKKPCKRILSNSESNESSDEEIINKNKKKLSRVKGTYGVLYSKRKRLKLSNS